MLCRCNGASTLCKQLSRNSGVTMSTFNALTAVTTQSRTASTVSTLRTPLNTLWNPLHGIVFGCDGRAPVPSNARALSTTTLEQGSPENANLETSYILASSAQSALSNSPSSQPPSSLSTSDDASWVSATSQIQSTQEESEVIDKDKPREKHTPLSFRMPEDTFKKAKDAEAGSSASYWTHSLYRGPEGQKVRVHYCKSLHTTERCLKQYFVGKPVLGFDIEWKYQASSNSGRKSNVALVQLACEDRIMLSHLALFPKDGVEDLVAPTLKKIMEDPEITKVGVNIKGDCTRLRKWLEIDSKGVFELSHLYKLIKYSQSGDYRLINKKVVSLATQTEDHLGLPLFKGEVRGSDWTENLSMEQILYAASDSYAGFMLFDKLECARKELDPTPPMPYHAELNIPIRLADGVVIETTEETTDDSPRKTSKTAPGVDETGQDVSVEQECDAESTPTLINPGKGTKFKAPANSLATEAAEFAIEHRSQYPSCSCPPSALRAYYIWHNHPDLSIPEIAAAMRTPPLATSTVLTYILDAARLEGVKGHLEVDGERLRNVLQHQNGGAAGDKGQWRWKGLWQLIERQMAVKIKKASNKEQMDSHLVHGACGKS